MRKIELCYDRIIIFLTFILSVFHTFTFFQLYYNFTVTLGIFALILLLYLMKTRGRIKIRFPGSTSLFFLYFSIIPVILLGVLYKGNNPIQMIGAFSPLAIWPTLYVLVNQIMSHETRKKFIYVYLCTLAISVIATLSVVIYDNDAARLLAGAASDAARTAYYRLGVGGYGFVYGCVFLVYGMIMLTFKEERAVFKTSLIILVTMASVMIVFASYTTALLILLIEFALTLYTKSTRKGSTIIFTICVVGIAFFLTPILELIHKLATSMNLYWISNRIGQLIGAEESGNIEGLKRTHLYIRSLNSFCAHPILGGTEIGGHSMVFDVLGQYGIPGIGLIVGLTGWFFFIMRSFKTREGLIFLLILILFLINTVDTITLYPIIAFILPLICRVERKKPV